MIGQNIPSLKSNVVSHQETKSEEARFTVEEIQLVLFTI